MHLAHAWGRRLGSALARLTEAQKLEVVGSPKGIINNIGKAAGKPEDCKQTSDLDDFAKSGDES